MVHIDSARTHRTALFIDGDALEGDYRERVERLLQSLNGENIKTDIFSVSSSLPVNGNGVQRIESLTTVGKNGAVAKPSDAELSAWAEDQGYVQVLFSKPAGV